MISFPQNLPVTKALPEVTEALEKAGRAVLIAPPGAGKTSLVPLALMEARDHGRILMLEPRRLAARAAAERMASLLGDAVGGVVGYRFRGESKVSARTRIEVVTEGVLTRMLQSDPSLEGVGAVIFDEFHERSLHADLGLALSWEVRGALRPDLWLLVMSATLDATPIASLMDGAPVIRSEGRAFPVETRWLDRRWGGPRGRRLEDEAAALISRAHGEEPGDILAFLPGASEIHRVAAALTRLDERTDIRPLYGAMRFADQRAALASAPDGRRKIVLATSIAETSLTVEGVRVVVDAGRARRARHDPASGMSRLVTERAAKAEAEQRRGRAGRIEPGVCYRMWTKGEEAALAPFAPPEIETADLTSLALELAAWGAGPDDLSFLTPPPEAAFAAAKMLLADLGALDAAGWITVHGRAVAAAPTHPRLAHMILTAPAEEQGVAVALAALLEERDPLRGVGADIGLRLAALAAPKGPAEGGLRRIRDAAARLGGRLGVKPRWRSANPGALLALAYPDRVAVRRKGGVARYHLSGGKGASLAQEDSLAGEAFLAVAETDGDPKEASIRFAAPISKADIETIYAQRVMWEETCAWSRRHRRVEAERRRMRGSAALETHRWDDAPEDILANAMCEGVRDLGLEALPWSPAATRFAARVEWARARGADAPALDAGTLTETLEGWLAPYLGGRRAASELASLDLAAILRAHVGWEAGRAVDKIAPESVTAPTGTVCRIDYGGAQPSIAVRLQELFGLDHHPEVGGAALVIELLSPAGRTVQTTADLPGFWRTSYADVRKDMRGRYPKHPWPEDPLSASPTRRAKPRA